MPTSPPVLTDAGLEGAVIIVTGGGSGIGAATARRFGTAGAPVIPLDGGQVIDRE